MFPFAARHHFLQHGWALVKNVLNPSTVSLLRGASLAAASSRWKQLCDIPSIDVIFQRRQSKFSDPPLQHLVTHLEKRRFLLRYFRRIRHQRKEQKRIIEKLLNGRKKEDLTEEEIWKFTALLQKEILKTQGDSSSASCDRTIHNDPQMLQAISEYRANLWMTHPPLESVLRSGVLAEKLGKLAEEIGGIEKPVVFGDAPLLRDAFGGGVGYHFTAPLFGARTTKGTRSLAVTLIPFTFTPSSFCMEPHVLMRGLSPPSTSLHPASPSFSRGDFFSSHCVVQSYLSYGGAATGGSGGRHSRRSGALLRELFSPFLLNEYHIPFQLQRLLQFGLLSWDSSGTTTAPKKGGEKSAEEVEEYWEGRSLLSLCSSSPWRDTTGPDAIPRDKSSIVAGDVLVLNPHLLLAFGPNLTAAPELVYRVNVVSQSAKPFLGSPSWIRGWRSLPQEVCFAAPKVFPPLHRTN